MEYLENPPSRQQLEQIIQQVGIRPSDLVRTQEPLFKELRLAGKTLSDAEWLTILIDNPQLIQRPIVLHNGQAAIGRPIERIIELLDA